MTKEQLLYTLQQEIALNKRLSQMLVEYGTIEANDSLRKNFNVTDHAILIHNTAMAKGIDNFISEITKLSKDSVRK